MRQADSNCSNFNLSKRYLPSVTLVEVVAEDRIILDLVVIFVKKDIYLSVIPPNIATER